MGKRIFFAKVFFCPGLAETTTSQRSPPRSEEKNTTEDPAQLGRVWSTITTNPVRRSCIIKEYILAFFSLSGINDVAHHY